MKEHVRTASTEEQCQVVGALGREVLISLAQAVYDRNVHGAAADGIVPSDTDAKRMLDRYIEDALPGGSNEDIRRFTKCAVAFAPAVAHKRTATLRDATLCAVATQTMVQVIEIISGRKGGLGLQPTADTPSAAELPEPLFKSLPSPPVWTFSRRRLSGPEQCWLELLVTAFNSGVRPPDHILLRRHWDRLGAAFDPRTVDPVLAAEDGRDITPLGLWHVDPDTPWLERVDLVFRYVKQLIEQNPAVDELSVSAVAEKLGLTQRDVSHSLHLLRTCHGWCCASAGGNQDPEHYLVLYSTFSVGKEQVFRFYERFRTLDEVICGTLLAPAKPREF